MRAFIAIALAWLLAIAGPSSAQMTLTGAGSTKGAGAAPLSPVTLTFQMPGGSSTSSNIDTFSITFGSALAANQRVAVVYSTSSNTVSGPFVSAVFTPNIGSPINSDPIIIAGTDSTTNFALCLASAVMPTGATSVTLTITYTGTVFSGSQFAVYTLDNTLLSSTTPTHTFVQTTASPSSASIATPAGSGLIADFFGFGTNTNGWTAGVTSDGAFNVSNWGHTSNATASASYTVTNTWTTSGSGNPDLALWVYR